MAQDGRDRQCQGRGDEQQAARPEEEPEGLEDRLEEGGRQVAGQLDQRRARGPGCGSGSSVRSTAICQGPPRAMRAQVRDGPQRRGVVRPALQRISGISPDGKRYQIVRSTIQPVHGREGEHERVEPPAVRRYRGRHGGHDGDDGQLRAAVQKDARSFKSF